MLYPYAQIMILPPAYQSPACLMVLLYFNIKRFIGVFDEDLQEEGYDDIKEKKKNTKLVKVGWVLQINIG